MNKKLRTFTITKDISIKGAMRHMRDLGEKVLFLIDEKQKLIGALSDGDIRRWILSGGSLEEAVAKIYNAHPRFVKENYEIKDVKKIMLDFGIECVPVVNRNKKITNVLTWEEVFAGKVSKQKQPINAEVVVMAGGKGTRLDPFTRILPKPLIPIGDKPIIEIIMDKFCAYGVADFHLSVNHKARMLKSYFEETSGRYNIQYIEEKKPLGTIGSLKFINGKGGRPVVVTNCDIIIDCDYAELLAFHEEHHYDITIVVSCKNYVIPYGVCEIENGGKLTRIKEKPEYDLLINTGMYVINRNMIDLIPKNRFFNTTDLIAKAKQKGKKVGAFPINEKAWVDVGQWEEYHKAIDKMRMV